MPTYSRFILQLAVMILSIAVLVSPVSAQDEQNKQTTADRPGYKESARQHDGQSPPKMENPPLPEGMTLDEVLDRAAAPPPATFPEPVPDDRIYAFTIFEQFEYRFGDNGADDHLGWEAQGWIGGAIDKFWWKNEGEAVFEGEDEGETETDLLYSRLVTPFWNAQLGLQYANGWNSDDYEDRWSGVIALQGLAPYMFELDTSLYISEEGDVTLAFEAEYDLRITQRLVLQPRVELGLAAQDIPERSLGAGVTDGVFDLRLRYEIKREFAPYIGARYQTLFGETEDIADDAGADTDHVFLIAGLRFAF